MKIGLLAYHAACNFGAFLQLLSTVEHIRKRGDEPVVINWVPRDFIDYYERISQPDVRALYNTLRGQYYPMTRRCETDKEVASIVEEENIDAVIIGSDAVLQHHPLRERVHFPVRRIIYIAHVTSDRMYPNCFWGTFKRYLSRPIPVAVISGSSQDSKYYYIKGKTKMKMKDSCMEFSYLSVRDEWTCKMIEYLTDNNRQPKVTPDPVFGFNQNAGHLIPSKGEILEKFQIPNNYLLVSFKGTKSVDQDWISSFEKMANQCGLSCVKLPYADGIAFGEMKYTVGDSISPLDWYALIKYSKGYIGNNMHPIVTSIHNGVPFFSFDNYGISKEDGRPTNGESSKIYHILKKADLLEYRIFVGKNDYETIKPTPERVLLLIESFNKNKEINFAKSYYEEYERMMDEVFLWFGL